MGGTGQQENLCQPFKSGSYPLRLTSFLGDAPQAGLGTSAPCLSNVGSCVWCRSVLKALKARALALVSGDGSCRCSLAGTERTHLEGSGLRVSSSIHGTTHIKKCQSTEPQSRYRQWDSLLSATKVKQGPRLPKTCLSAVSSGKLSTR